MNILIDLAATGPWILIGYLLGSFNFAIVYSKWFRNEDIRERGSQNAGATNIRRIYGAKISFIIGFFDILKLFLAVLIAFFIKIHLKSFNNIFLGLVGISVILGHIFPIYFNFKGGKGAACLLGFLIIMHWWLLPFGVLVFCLIVKRFKIVSLGTLIAPGIWILCATILGLIFYFNQIDVTWNLPLANTEPWWVNIIYDILAYLLVIIMHISNIKRLLYRNENKII